MIAWRQVLGPLEIPTILAWAVAVLASTQAPASAAANEFISLGTKAKVSALATMAPASAESLSCASAIPLAVGDVKAGSNAGAVNHVDQYGCETWMESGGEVVYRLSIPTPMRVQIDLQSDCDLDLALLSGCDAINDCLLVADTGIRSSVPVSGEFYLVVDGFNGAECAFQLSVSEFVTPEARAAVCVNALPSNCGSPAILTGTTCGTGNDIAELECSYSHAKGEDRVIRLRLLGGGFVDATLSMPQSDAVLWILGGCGDDTECLGFADEGLVGEDEHIRFENHSGVTRDVFVIIDSFDDGSCADYSLVLDCFGSVVATETTSWSALKQVYRSAPSAKEGGHE